MSNSKTNPKVNWYFEKEEKWKKEISELRKIVLDCGLDEELKWGCPCYTFEKNNIVLIHVFKEYCAYLFFKGVLLNDKEKILIQQTENVQSARQIRFTNLKEIIEMESIIKSYIFDAVEVEKSGLKVELKRTKEYKIPEEFQEKLNDNSRLNEAFKKLTPGRQRAYILYFSAPKQSATRESRVEKYMDRILDGLGIND